MIASVGNLGEGKYQKGDKRNENKLETHAVPPRTSSVDTAHLSWRVCKDILAYTRNPIHSSRPTAPLNVIPLDSYSEHMSC